MLASSIFLGGCGSRKITEYYAKSGVSPEAYKIDKSVCVDSAVQNYVKTRNSSNVYNPPVNSSGTLVGAAGTGVIVGIAQGVEIARDKQAARTTGRQCMFEKGYEIKAVEPQYQEVFMQMRPEQRAEAEAYYAGHGELPK